MINPPTDTFSLIHTMKNMVGIEIVIGVHPYYYLFYFYRSIVNFAVK